MNRGSFELSVSIPRDGRATPLREFGHNGFTYGLLYRAEAASASDIEAELPAAREALRRKKAVRWLTP